MYVVTTQLWIKTLIIVGDESCEDTVPDKQEQRPSTKRKSVKGDKTKRSV